jgi:hypothetical protein
VRRVACSGASLVRRGRCRVVALVRRLSGRRHPREPDEPPAPRLRDRSRLFGAGSLDAQTGAIAVRE